MNRPFALSRFWLKSLLLLLGSHLILTTSVEASHYRGGAASYTIGSDGFVNLTVYTAWRSDLVDATSFVMRTAPGTGGTSLGSMTRASTELVGSGTEYGGGSYIVNKEVFRFDLSAQPAGLYYARWQSCCWVAGINNMPEGNMSLQLAIAYTPGVASAGPTMIPATIDIIARGSTYTQNLNTVDPDGTPVVVTSLVGNSSPHWAPTSAIPGLSVSTLGGVTIPASSTANLALGRWSYKVEATDASGGTAIRDVLVVVQEAMGNNEPVLSPIGPKQAAVQHALSFPVSATDPDTGNTLTLRAQLLPPGATFPTASGPASGVSSTFAWTPSPGQEGTYLVNFEVYDNAATVLIDSELVTITVTGDNHPPVLAPVGNRTVANGATLNFTVSATDEDDDDIAYSVFNAPAGFAIHPSTGVVTWTPVPAQYDSTFVGITIRATDNGVPNLYAEETIAVTVGGGNQPPSFVSSPDHVLIVGTPYSIPVSAVDPNGTQTLSIYPTATLPPGASFSNVSGPATGTSGAFEWTPSAGNLGLNTVVFRVQDNGVPSLSTDLAYTFDVINPPPPSVEDTHLHHLTGTAAHIEAHVNPNGAPTSVVFEISTDPQMAGASSSPAKSIGGGVLVEDVDHHFNGLLPGTVYYVRATATNSSGATSGEIVSFTTLSNNADLSSLALSSGTLAPAFAAGTTGYTASVSNATGSITATPTRDHANATIEVRVNGGAYAGVASGSPSGSLALNIGANTMEVLVTAQDGSTQKTYTVTVTRDKAAQTIVFPAITDKLTTDTVPLSATGGGSLNPVTFVVTSGPAVLSVGNVLTFTGAGSVTITASQAGNDNYHPATSVTRTFNVTKDTATVTLTNLSHTYDGSAKAAGATTNPSGKTVTFTYNGSGTAPTNAGSYAVVGTINDAIYQGSASGTLVIAKASQTINFPAITDKLTTDTVNLSATGGTSGNGVTFTVTSGPAVLGGGNVLTFIGAGSVTVTASQAGNSNYEAATPVQQTFNVTKDTAAVTLTNLSHTYDGSAKAAGATTNPSGKTVTFTYNGSGTPPTEAGSYAVVGTINDAIYQGSASGTLVIAKASQAVNFPAITDKLTTDTVPLSATGGGSDNDVTFVVTSGPAVLGGGNVLTFTGAGSVTVTASQAGNANYEAATPVQQTFNVTKDTAAVTLTNLSHTYDGSAKAAGATTNPSGKTVAFTYGGSATPPTDAGSYAVVGTIDDAIYQGSASGTLVIAKASQTIVFADPGDQLATTTVTLSASGGGSNNVIDFIATGPISLSGNQLSFTGPGSVTVRATQAGNANYETAPEVSHTFNVAAEAATIALSRLHQVADGTAREAVATTDPADLEVELTYDGSSTAPTVPGSYAVAATFVDPRYAGSASGTLVVDDPARAVTVPGGWLPSPSSLGELAVPTFQIGAYEVTGSQWAAVVAWAEANAEYDFAGAGSAASGDRPVTGVSWFDAAKWCNARTEWENATLGRSLAPAYRLGGEVFKTGSPASPDDLVCDFGTSGHRLPTAEEWEFAARGGTGGASSTYPGGEDPDALGWHLGNSGGAAQPAGGKAPNGLGLHDLVGNAAEWTWDAPSGNAAQRLLRGGSWQDDASAAELTALVSADPALQSATTGFRLARSVSLALAEALDHVELAWESGGDALWFAQTGTTHDGEDAAESGPLMQGQAGWLEAAVEGPGNLRFRWKIAGTEGIDAIAFAIDGTTTLSHSGTGEWEERLVEIDEGTHTLRWTYARGSDSGEARAWLDAVEYEAATVATVTTAPATDIASATATLGGEVVEDGGREVTVRGVVYATAPDPTLDTGTVLTVDDGGLGDFTVSAAGLEEGTTYFARAYATNNLGTVYGESVAFTTDTTAVFTNGTATFDRDILPGDSHRYLFALNGPRFVSISTTGGASLRAVLRDASGRTIAVFEGDSDFSLLELLYADGYVLEIHRLPGGETGQSYALVIDISRVAATRPDVAVGASSSALRGRSAYGPRQVATLVSRRARRMVGHAAIANRGNLPDMLSVRADRGNAFFSVRYFSSGGNRTAALLAGSYTTPVITASNREIPIRISIKPNKRKLVKKAGRRSVSATAPRNVDVSRHGSIVRDNTILRKSRSFGVKATSNFDPSIRDAASIKARTK